MIRTISSKSRGLDFTIRATSHSRALAEQPSQFPKEWCLCHHFSRHSREISLHADPSNTPPHLMESVHSTFAPIGGMTLDAAMNDQLMFSQLTATGLPSNSPLVSYKYHELFLDEKPMGVSVSQLPANALSITPYHLYLAWHQPVVSRES